MSQNLPNMLENTIARIREMVDVNSVIGNPITTPDGVTIIPVSKVSVGFGGGGSDFANKNPNAELPFGGGVGGGVKVSPIAFALAQAEAALFEGYYNCGFDPESLWHEPLQAAREALNTLESKES